MADFLTTYNAVIVFIAINGVLAFSTYAVLIAGQLSLAQAAFASIAAYTSALASIELGLPFPLVVLLGMAVAALVAFLLGLPVLRLRGVFLAIATIGFGEVVRVVALNLGITGGAMGLRQIPKVVEIWHAYLALAVCAFFFWRLRPSKLGRGLAALRQDEVAARAMGVDTVRYKLYVFTVSGAMAGLSGVLFAHFTRFIAPEQFGFIRAVDALMYAIVGGIGHWLGPILGGGFLTFLPELQRQLGVEAGWLRPFLNGLILLGVILFVPSGLVGVAQALGLGGRRRPSGPPAPSEAESTSRPQGQHPPASEPAPATDAQRAARPDTGVESETLVRLRGLGKDYGGVKALAGVDLDVRAGEILGLIGPNGAGKTTLVNVLTGLTPPSRGEAVVLGADSARLPANRITELGVARTFQQSKLFATLSARENVMVGGHRIAEPTFLRRLALLPSARRDEAAHLARAERCLALVGLQERADEPAGSLSYGDQRRLEIARSLCAEPRLLVLDEPAAGMNQVEAGRLADLIADIAAQGITVLLIEHNVRLVMRTCTRVVVLDFGRIIADGEPAAVARDPEVIRAYLGEAHAAASVDAAAGAGEEGNEP
jgi:branched-chain amino acid transport system permease protein